MRASSFAMLFGESTKSTQPAATALRGIESYLADSSCAKVIPPSALMASSPSVPSVAVPERITPMARSRWSCASDSKKEVNGAMGARCLAGAPEASEHPAQCSSWCWAE